MDKSEEMLYFNFNKKITDIKKNSLDIDNALIHIITTYSGKNINFQQTINSVINQTFLYWKWTIICTNDELDFNLQDDNRINTIKQNKDVCDIRNGLINNGKYEYVFILDENSILDETMLECSYWTMQTNPDASWCYSNYVINNSSLGNALFMSEDEKNANIVSKSYLIRKNDLLQVGGYEKKLEKTNIDWLLFLKLLSENKYPVKMDFYGSWDNLKEDVKTDEIVKESKKIENKLMGINYPVGSDYWFDTQPFELEWDKNLENTNKTNLLFIFPWFKVGGADKFNFDLISNLDKEKYNITIITTEPCNYIWRQKFEDYAEIFDLTSFLHRKYWAPFIHYIIKTRNINLVMNSNSFYGYYAIPWLKSKFPKVIFTDYLHAVNWNWRHGEYPIDSTAISRLLDKTFVSNKALDTIMQEKMGRTKSNTKVVYIGVDTNKFNINNEEIKLDEDLMKYREKYEGKKVILFCARISDEKRPLLMVKIMEELCKRRKDVVLFVVGDGNLLQNMKELAKELNLQDDIIFFGMKEEVRPFYKEANVLVNCSIREGIPLTTYEALSMSVPIVTGDVGGQSEIIDNSCGIIVKNIQNVADGEKNKEFLPEEIKIYSDAIEKILDNSEYEQMRINCRKRIKDNFTINKMVSDIETEFDTLIKEGSKIPIDLINNEEFYKNHLVLFNEYDRRYYNSAKGGIIPEREYSNEEILKQTLDKAQNQIKDYEEQLKQKNYLIEEKEKELKNIISSKRWRYTQKLLKFFNK